MASGALIAGKHLTRPSGHDVEDLEEDALAELAEDDGLPGPAGIELALRALYYGAYHGTFRIPRNDLGRNADRRQVHHVLQDMLGTEVGIRQLGRIIEDGRDGDAPVVIDADGEVQNGSDGEPAPLTDDDIRYKLYPRGANGGGGSDDPVESIQLKIRKAVKELHADFDMLEAADSGRAQRDGLPPRRGKYLVEGLEELRQRANNLFMIGLSKATPAELAQLASGAPVHATEGDGEDSDAADDGEQG